MEEAVDLSIWDEMASGPDAVRCMGSWEMKKVMSLSVHRNSSGQDDGRMDEGWKRVEKLTC